MTPFRPGHDPKIPPLEGVDPMNTRLYKYDKIQKDAIAKLVQKYLKSWAIQNSSPYVILIV